MKSVYINAYEKQVISYGKESYIIISYLKNNGTDQINDFFDRYFTKESNITDISDSEQYLDNLFEMLNDKYDFPVDQSAIYYADISVFATWNYYLLRIKDLVLVGQLAQRNLC